MKNLQSFRRVPSTRLPAKKVLASAAMISVRADEANFTFDRRDAWPAHGRHSQTLGSGRRHCPRPLPFSTQPLNPSRFQNHLTIQSVIPMNLVSRIHLVLLVVLVLPLARAEEIVVKWSSLKKLDDLAERCEALCERKDVTALRKIASLVKYAAKAVESEPVPKGAKSPDEVKVLQADLKSLADSIGDPVKQDGEELTAILAGIHPVVEKLMEASGMPHVHEKEEKEEKPK